MRKRVFLLALTSVLMSLCIPAFAQQPQGDSTVALRDVTAELIEKVKSYDMTHEEAIEFHKKLVESEYVIEIGKISKKTKVTSQEYKNFSNKKTYKVSEGISLKELISRLPGVKTDKDGKLITSQRKTSNKAGYTDRSIFLPYFFFGTSGDMGYWADSFDPGSPNRSATLWINVYEDYFNSGYCYRNWELPVRPVCK